MSRGAGATSSGESGVEIIYLGQPHQLPVRTVHKQTGVSSYEKERQLPPDWTDRRLARAGRRQAGKHGSFTSVWHAVVQIGAELVLDSGGKD